MLFEIVEDHSSFCYGKGTNPGGGGFLKVKCGPLADLYARVLPGRWPNLPRITATDHPNGHMVNVDTRLVHHGGVPTDGGSNPAASLVRQIAEQQATRRAASQRTVFEELDLSGPARVAYAPVDLTGLRNMMEFMREGNSRVALHGSHPAQVVVWVDFSARIASQAAECNARIVAWE